MAVNTSRITERRQVRYDSFNDLLLDAELLAQSEVLTVGNWTLGQIFSHLARTMQASMDGMPGQGPWWLRLTVKLFYARRLLAGPMPVGLRLPDDAAQWLSPEPINVEEGLAALREAVERLGFETERAAHPLLGDMSIDQWDSFHLRHAELHMSFALPLQVPALV